MHPRDQFRRTVCACGACRRNCHFLPGMLAPGDIQRIAAHLGIDQEGVEAVLLASPGARVAKMTPKGIVTFRIPTIVPQSRADAQDGCVFLTSDGQCRVHPVAPYGCSHFDDHMDAEEGNRRSRAVLRMIMQDEEYKTAWQRLKDAGRTSATPDAKRARMNKATRNPT